MNAISQISAIALPVVRPTAAAWSLILAVLIGMPRSSLAGFNVIDFEDIPPTGTPVDSFGQTFAGLRLISHDRWVADAVSDEFVHLKGRAITAFSAGDAPLWIAFDSPVQDVTLDFGSSFRHAPITVGVTGYLADQLIFTADVATSPGITGVHEVRAVVGSVAVDQLVVARTGGSVDTILDNLAFDTTPVPEPWVLPLLSAAALMLFTRARRDVLKTRQHLQAARALAVLALPVSHGTARAAAPSLRALDVSPLAVSADGSVVVGTGSRGATRWTAATGAATIPEAAALPFFCLIGLLFAPRRGRDCNVTLVAVSVLVASAILILPASAAPVFEVVATHPDAAAQPTTLGQSIQTLKPFNGKLYAGYGDYFTNTGPIAVRAFDPATGSFGPALLSAQTEALLIYREVGGKLYAPHIDPWPSPPPPEGELGGYSLGVANGATESWSDERLVPGIHMLDVATFDGSDLWIAGSRVNATGGTDAVAWRSRDGGATWQVSLVVPPQRAGATIARLYAIQAYNGRLYTQGQDSNPGDATWGPHTTSKVFDGTSWTDGPSLGGGLIGNMWHPEPFAGELVWDRLHGGTAGRMSKFDGTRTALAYPDFNTTIYDYTIDGDVLYALISDGRIVRTSDLVTWSLLDTAPASARSLGVLDGTLYVGGTGGQLFRYGVPVPEPAALPLLALAGYALTRHRRRTSAR